MTDGTLTPENLDSRLVARRPWLDDVVALPRFRCRTRVLLVADGGLDFGTGGFGLSTTVNNLKGMSTFWHEYDITTAHRGGGVADIQGFTFDSSVTRANYDQIWLFGISVGPGLPGAELARVTAFMDDGGGVFATGDHEALGSAMSANIPRVKSMRLWHFPPAPSGSNQHRIDTVSMGPTPDFQFDDQSDAVAQTIYPRYYAAASGTTSYPHALLRGPHGDITVLPDHAHEGECVTPAALDPAEFPPLAGGTPFGPEVIALGVSRAGFLTDIHKPPVVPRGFGVIGAYDGRRVGLGRVVVQSTWHHYVNINLVGTGAPGRIGLQSSPGTPTADLQSIFAYQRNIVRWLDPRSRCWFLSWPLVLRYEWPLIEELPPKPDPQAPFEDLARVGQAVRATVSTMLGETEAAQLSVELVDLLPRDIGAVLAPLVDPWFPEAAREGVTLPRLLRSDAIADVLLGAAMTNLAAWLPDDPSGAAAVVEKNGGREGYERVLAEGVTCGATVVAKTIRESSERFGRLAKQLA